MLDTTILPCPLLMVNLTSLTLSCSDFYPPSPSLLLSLAPLQPHILPQALKHSCPSPSVLFLCDSPRSPYSTAVHLMLIFLISRLLLLVLCVELPLLFRKLLQSFYIFLAQAIRMNTQTEDSSPWRNQNCIVQTRTIMEKKNKMYNVYIGTMALAWQLKSKSRQCICVYLSSVSHDMDVPQLMPWHSSLFYIYLSASSLWTTPTPCTWIWSSGPIGNTKKCRIQDARPHGNTECYIHISVWSVLHSTFHKLSLTARSHFLPSKCTVATSWMSK